VFPLPPGTGEVALSGLRQLAAAARNRPVRYLIRDMRGLRSGGPAAGARPVRPLPPPGRAVQSLPGLREADRDRRARIVRQLLAARPVYRFITWYRWRDLRFGRTGRFRQDRC